MEYVLAAVLFIAGGLVTTGAAMLSPSAGWIIAGLLLAGWSLVVFRGIEAAADDLEGDL